MMESNYRGKRFILVEVMPKRKLKKFSAFDLYLKAKEVGEARETLQYYHSTVLVECIRKRKKEGLSHGVDTVR